MPPNIYSMPPYIFLPYHLFYRDNYIYYNTSSFLVDTSSFWKTHLPFGGQSSYLFIYTRYYSTTVHYYSTYIIHSDPSPSFHTSVFLFTDRRRFYQTALSLFIRTFPFWDLPLLKSILGGFLALLRS